MVWTPQEIVCYMCWAESFVDCPVPGPAEFVAFLNGVTRRSKLVVNKNILLGILSMVN